MTNLRRAKLMLPNMPNEVFETWLHPIIKDHNSWPYYNIHSPHPSQQWNQYFGLYPLSDISNCLWHRIQLSFDMSCLDPLSTRTIDTLIQRHVHDLDTSSGLNIRNSRSRFFGFVELINNTGSIPAPIIGINTSDGLRILDGNHRLSALTYLGFRGRISCDTWVGGSQ